MKESINFSDKEIELLSNYSFEELVAFANTINNLILQEVNFGKYSFYETKYHDHNSPSRKAKDLAHATFNPFGTTAIAGEGNRVKGLIGDLTAAGISTVGSVAGGLAGSAVGKAIDPSGVGSKVGALTGAMLGGLGTNVAAKYLGGRALRAEKQHLKDPKVISKLKELHGKGRDVVMGKELWNMKNK